MVTISIKPLSVNQAWQGKRYRSKLYKAYAEELKLKLPKSEVHPGEIYAFYEWGFSSKLSDNDNPVKPFQDVLSDKYGFNDRDIKTSLVAKELVKKGEEYIKFDLYTRSEYVQFLRDYADYLEK